MSVVFFFLGTYIGKLNVTAAFVFAIDIIVANVPEGLLPTVSLSLAMAAQVSPEQKMRVVTAFKGYGCDRDGNADTSS